VANSISQSLWEGQRNLSVPQRAAYVAAGLGLAAAGAKPRPNPLLNVLALLGGAFLAWSGYKGHCPVKAAFLDEGTPRHRISGRD
jgi:threonine/homoserine/homoserine lactone efflux protein